MMTSPPNTFLPWWKAAELRAWLGELYWRKKSESWKGHPSAPTIKQVEEEMKRRRMKISRRAIP